MYLFVYALILHLFIHLSTLFIPSSTLLSIYSSIHPAMLWLIPPSSGTCGMGFPYLMLEGSSIGSSILLSQIPNESQVTGRPLASLSKRTAPLARRTPNDGPPTCRVVIHTVRQVFPKRLWPSPSRNTQVCTHLSGRCGGFWCGARGEEGLPGEGGASWPQQTEQHCRRHGWSCGGNTWPACNSLKQIRNYKMIKWLVWGIIWTIVVFEDRQ